MRDCDNEGGHRSRSRAAVRARLLLGCAVLVAMGFGLGWLARSATPVARQRKVALERPRQLVPRPAISERGTVIVGEVLEPFDDEDWEGNVLLRPAGQPRVLVFDVDEVDAAGQMVERFVTGLKSELVTDREPGRALIDGVRLLWRVEGEGEGRRLRVVALPTSPYRSDASASQLAEALGEFALVNDLCSTTFSRFDGHVAAVTAVHASMSPKEVPIFDAAQAEFRDQGLTLAMEELAMATVVFLARDAEERVLWTFSWEEDQNYGTFHVRHYADPFDTSGEQEMLLAIFKRALGRSVRIRLEDFR